MRFADLTISKEKLKFTKFFTTEINYKKNNKGRLICEDKTCKDACSGDSGKIFQILMSALVSFYRWASDAQRRKQDGDNRHSIWRWMDMH